MAVFGLAQMQSLHLKERVTSKKLICSSLFETNKCMFSFRWKDIDFGDLMDALRFPGFQKLARKYIMFGTSEMVKSIFIRLQLKELQKYIPEVTAADIQRYK
jgi:hypothetical protein